LTAPSSGWSRKGSNHNIHGAKRARLVPTMFALAATVALAAATAEVFAPDFRWAGRRGSSSLSARRRPPRLPALLPTRLPAWPPPRLPPPRSPPRLSRAFGPVPPAAAPAGARGVLYLQMAQNRLTLPWTHGTRHLVQLFRNIPCGHGEHMAQLRLSLPCGQAVHCLQFERSLPCGQVRHIEHFFFRLPCLQAEHFGQSGFTLPCGHGLQNGQQCFTRPCGQGLHSLQLCLWKPWGHALQSLHHLFHLP